MKNIETHEEHESKPSAGDEMPKTSKNTILTMRSPITYKLIPTPKKDKRVKEGNIKWGGEHQRARGVFGKKTGTCTECKTIKNTEIHHIDHDWHNNSRINLQELCRSCHYWKHNKIKTCIIDGCNNKNKAFGLCTRHYQTYKRNGDPLKLIKNNNSIKGNKKICFSCKSWKTLDDYYQFKNKNKMYFLSNCKICHNKNVKPNRI